VSVSELFSQRYAARIGSGDLFHADLHLHDYRLLEDEIAERLTPPEDAENEHIDAEWRLRVQVDRAVQNANEKRSVKDLPRRARRKMADAYLQARQPYLSQVAEKDLDWLVELAGTPPLDPPFNGSKWGVAANLLLFDFIEVFFDLLPAEEQLDFSRDLNARLQNSGSRWYFQLGRWRRDDWPRDRDAPFDVILYSLKRQSETALARRRNAAETGDGVSASPFDAEASAGSLEDAARLLWQADRLLSSDLLSDKVRHAAAVRAAREAFDACLKSFGGVVRGPFVKAKPPRDSARRGLGFFAVGADRPAPAALKGVEEPLAAAIRIKRLGHVLANGGHGVAREERLRLLERANLAEFVLRLVLFGLPSGKPDAEDAESEEVRRYSRLTAAESPPTIAGKRLNHGQGTVHLHLEDKATARLAVDLMARLSQFATGAATAHPGDGDHDALPVAAHPHPRAADMRRARMWKNILQAGGLLIAVCGLVAAGVVLGLNLAG